MLVCNCAALTYLNAALLKDPSVMKPSDPVTVAVESRSQDGSGSGVALVLLVDPSP